MKRLARIFLAGGLALCLVFLPGCRMFFGDPQVQFDAWMEQLPAQMLEPTNLNINYLLEDKKSYGIEDALYTLPFNTEEDYREAIRSTEEVLQSLKAFPRNSLREDQQLTLDVMMDYYGRNLKLYQYYYLDNSYLGSFIGFQAQLPLLLAEYEFHDQNDLDSYFNILELCPEYFQKYADQEKARQENGVGLSQTILDKVMEQCDHFTAEKRPFLVDVVNEKLDDAAFLDDAGKAQAKQKNEELLTTKLIEAYSLLKQALSGIEGDTEDLGLCKKPNGKGYYAALLQARTGTDMSVEQVKAYLEQRFQSYLQQFVQLAQQYPEAAERFQAGKGGTYCDFTTPEQNIEYLQQRFTEDYPPLGNLNYKIKKVPDSMKDNFSPAAYLQGKIDASQDAPEEIYINGEYTPSLFSTLAHEGYPGHMYQHSYFKSTKPPVVRFLMDYNGYSEGWATYVENNIWQYAQGDDENRVMLHMQQLNQQLVQMKIGLFDIGIHYEGWDRERFKQEILENFGEMEEAAIQEQYDLILETPTNYLQYYLNGSLFQEMYEQAQQKLGDRFDPVAFHRVLLETGPAPQRILQEKLDAYIQTAKSARQTWAGASAVEAAFFPELPAA